jgi:hypothetical protein
MPTAVTRPPGTDLVLREVSAGKIVKMGDLLKTLYPDAVVIAGQGPAKVPTITTISDAQKAALALLPAIFGKVVPTERRLLTTDELVSVKTERETLDTIAKMIETRKEDIRTTLYNHFDVLDEELGFVDPETEPRDAKGFYVRPAEYVVGERKFVRQVSEGAPSFQANNLEALINDPDADGFDPDRPSFTRAQYLSMTTQTRVVDEAKIMIELRKHPELLDVIQQVAKPGNKTSSFYLR